MTQLSYQPNKQYARTLQGGQCHQFYPSVTRGYGLSDELGFFLMVTSDCSLLTTNSTGVDRFKQFLAMLLLDMSVVFVRTSHAHHHVRVYRYQLVPTFSSVVHVGVTASGLVGCPMIKRLRSGCRSRVGRSTTWNRSRWPTRSARS